jgi:membrane peptidoglycan carboxypeptidase
MPKRHVRRPARPIEDHTPGFKGHLKRFFLSFTPKYFKSYWISRDGLRRIGKLAGAFLVFIFLVFLWYAKDLPTPGKINAQLTAQSTKFYDSSGQHLLYTVYGNTNRDIVQFNQISQNAKDATIAIEDKNFYHEGAFSTLSILRAAVIDLTHHGLVQGGSTITQQYVKNALLDPTDRSFGRKIKELILSIEISQFYSKTDILDMYLNEIPYGAGAYGVESACKTFFPQDIDHSTTNQLCAENLNLGQSALLAAILNAPTYYSPFGENQQALIDRQHLVLQQMVQQKYISQAQANSAAWTLADLANTSMISEPQGLYAGLDPKVASYVLYAEQVLENQYGSTAVTEGGLKVITAMNYNYQMETYAAINDNMNTVRNSGGSNAAMVVTDPHTGHLLAMQGSYNFNDPNFGNFNVATATRQPGSSFKPIVYSTLIGTNESQSCAKTRACPTYGPGTTFYDVKTNFGSSSDPFIPQNFGNKLYGIVSMRKALAGSLNIPAVKALAMAGIPQTLQTASSLGVTDVTSANSCGLSLALGCIGVQLNQMANAYESFANGGMHYAQSPVLKVYNQKGKLVQDNTNPKGKQAIDPQVAYLMADMLSDENAKEYAFGNLLAIHNNCGNDSSTNCVHVGVKTGTTQFYNDAWTIGFTQNVVAGVWAGNNNDAPMTLEAADVSAPIWKEFMNTEADTPNSAFTRPSGIKTETLDTETGRAVTAGTRRTTVDLFPSWYEPMTSAGGRSATIDTLSGLLATNCTPPLAQETIYSSAIQPEILESQNPSQYQNWLSALQHAGYATSGGNIPTGSDNVHSCSDVQPTVNIVGAVGGGPYNLSVNVTSGTFTANKLQVYFDDQMISTQAINGSGNYPLTYDPTTTGNHTFKAVVTDAGLYQATNEATVDVTNTGGSSGAFQNQTPADSSTWSPPGQITFTWSDDGASKYTLFLNGNSQGSTGSTSKKVNVLTPGNYTWYVVDNDSGTQTTPTSFTVSP